MSIPHFPELERRILQAWRESDVFGQTLKKPSPKGRFVFYDGPPTANGEPHMGSVETRVFKDIIPRFKTMRGYHVDRKAGWDTQGLPVEIEVEKALGISGKKDIEAYGVEKFNAQAKDSVWKYKAKWEQMSERIGFWLDFDHPYIAHENNYIETLWWILRQTWDLKLLEQDFKVVPYCPRCGTALSSHEVAQGYKKVTDTAVYVKFELVDEPGTFVLAWTTTPWTLPGNVALAVDPEISYVKVKGHGSQQYILAVDLVEKVGLGEATIVSKVLGKELVGKKYKPLFDFIDLREVTRIPERAKRSEESRQEEARPVQETLRSAQGFEKAYTIVPAEFVTTEDGTGVVHTAVMYGEDDFQLGKKHNLPTVHTVDKQGRFNHLVKPWVGWEVKDPAEKTQRAIVQYLSDHGWLYKEEPHEHDYPFCWRCKHPLLYYAKTSWFIRMSQLREQLIAANEQINWYPSHIKNGRFGEWLREVKDWAISRERYWGTPLPIWKCDKCDHQECVGSYQELRERVPARNRYIFVRHGSSLNNQQGLVNSDVVNSEKYPLTAEGRKDVSALAKKLKKEQPAVIYASKFLRARETAEILSQAWGVQVMPDDRINEFQTGYDGRPHVEYQAFSATIDRFRQAPPGGETWYNIRSRMFSFLHEVDQRHEGQTIVVVSHADPLLILEWAANLQAESQLVPRQWIPQGGSKEIRLPMSLYRPDGSFDPHRPFIDGVTWPCTKCAPTPPDPSSGRRGTMRRVPEVGDTWFDSGSMPFAQWHYPFENKERIEKGENYPADYISEAIDQTRGWFYTLLAVSTILKQAKVVKTAAYKNVIVLGHINDTQGRKLAKSAGNYSDPMEVIEKYGADAVRWFMYTVNQPWDSKNFDPSLIEEGIRKTFLILLNVVSFWELYKTETTGTATSKHILDRWLSSRTEAMVDDVTNRLETYDITGAARQVGEFVTELSTWYVRRSRDRMKGDERAHVSVQLGAALRTVAVVMAPFTPFLSEDVYRRLGGQLDSVHLEDWPAGGKIDRRLLDDMATARSVVEEALSLRAKAGIKIRQPLQQLVVTTTLRTELDQVVQDELNVKEMHSKDQLPTGPDWAVGAKVALDISISDELREEGYLRDLVRELNALRKEAKLTPADQIIVHVPAGTVAAKLIERYQEAFLRDVRARGATPSLDAATATRTVKLDQDVTVGLSKA